MTDTTTAVPPTKLEQRARKATIANARVQLDMCKAAIAADDFNAARVALLKVGYALETLDPQPDGEHG